MNWREVIITAVRCCDSGKPLNMQLGDRAVRKAMAAAERAKSHYGDNVEKILDAITVSLESQERSKVCLRETDPRWIGEFLEYAA